MGPQPFAIVISGIGGNLAVIANSTIYPDGQTAAKNGDTITLGAIVTSIKGIWNVTVNATAINSSLAKVVLEKMIDDSYINSSVVINATGGIYKLNVTAYDNSSGKNNTTQLTVIVDNTPPLIFPNPVKYETNGSAHNNSVIIINVTASDNLFLKNVTADVSSVNSSGTVELVNSSGYWTYALLVRGQDGDHTINVTAYDGALNINRTEFNITIFNPLPEKRFINGTVMDSVNKTGIAGVTVSTNTSFSTTTDAAGFYSFEVTSGTYELTARLDPTYNTNNTITVSTIGSAVVWQDIELLKKQTGNITGSVTS